MKKLVFCFALILGCCMFSNCGRTAGAGASDSTVVDSTDTVLVDSTLTDSLAADSTVCPD